MLRTITRVFGLIVLPLAGCAGMPGEPLETVESVDIERYTGKWYEIASYPAPFQAGCVATTAEYAALDDGRISVVNQCRDGSFEGRLETIEGSARVVDDTTRAKLKVSFFWPFEGDYWVIDLDEDYQWAVVGEPQRRYLWILSRTPRMDEAVYNDILSRLPAKGYDPAALQQTPQPAVGD